MRFSERFGYKPIKEIIQIESMDEPLRNGLWSLLKLHCWDYVRHSSGAYSGYYLSDYGNDEIQALCHRLWFNYFKKPLDQLSDDWGKVLIKLRSYFFECKWYEAYDFIEFVAINYKRYQFQEEFIQSCNNLLKKEVSAYRFINSVITRITDEHEVAEIEQAIEASRGPVSKHLRRSLELLSDRNAPDYRNSIKESISAVESQVATTINVEKGTLGQLIKKLDNEIGLHPALKTAFSSLYGYTSDEGGIRHALTEATTVDFNDAKFMLVVCSAFINFVEGKLKNKG
ncbi:MAG: hypothetical protein KKD99_05875 [Proteobacteria bacterium]|nr:hypothetical protein [Pseudomonadota bacterium]MBU4354714.1 hypothetical protein [Pseudomonadota bacterium]MBU4448094.1 hypothetical protein [Pseudomonadota bacterium]MCG2772173.1 hypothetical protein [Desulfobacterales bacterium]